MPGLTSAGTFTCHVVCTDAPGATVSKLAGELAVAGQPDSVSVTAFAAVEPTLVYLVVTVIEVPGSAIGGAVTASESFLAA
ncbi:MAG TPA: hypothetical protein VL652_22865, partial [Kutzneria sp.]|nr:hypothetical protein [Kutzneria sp.]